MSGEFAEFPRRSRPGRHKRKFDLHMDAFATNTLMRSYYSEFLTNSVTTVVHYY